MLLAASWIDEDEQVHSTDRHLHAGEKNWRVRALHGRSLDPGDPRSRVVVRDGDGMQARVSGGSHPTPPVSACILIEVHGFRRVRV